MSERIEQLEQENRELRARVNNLEHSIKLTDKTMGICLDATDKRIAKLEEAVKESHRRIDALVKFGEEIVKPKPHCPTCKDSGEDYDRNGFTIPCPDCAEKDKEKVCGCVYESDCHGIRMIKSPSGKKWSVGGTNTQDRFKYCPWCGGQIEMCAPKTSCAHTVGYINGFPCVMCGADPQPERTLEQKLWKYFEGTGDPIRYEDFYKFAQIAEEHYKDKTNDMEQTAVAMRKDGIEAGRKQATEELQKKFEEAVKNLEFKHGADYLRSELFPNKEK